MTFEVKLVLRNSFSNITFMSQTSVDIVKSYDNLLYYIRPTIFRPNFLFFLKVDIKTRIRFEPSETTDFTTKKTDFKGKSVLISMPTLYVNIQRIYFNCFI